MIVRSVYASSAPGARTPRANASITLPVAVAWAMLGRPTRAMLATAALLATKSTVTASPSPGIDSVVVSPVAASSAARCGRASARRSTLDSAWFASRISCGPSR